MQYTKLKYHKLMKKQELYVTPTIEIVDCMVEQGFTGSNYGKDNEAGDNLAEDPWAEF